MAELNPIASGAPATSLPPLASGIFIPPLMTLRNHYRLALTLMIVVVIIGVPLAWYKSKGYSYEVFASVYVAPRFAKVLKSDQELEFQSSTQYQQYVEQQVHNITRYDIVRETLMRLGPYRALWQPPELSEHMAILSLSRALSAHVIGNTYLIGVTLEGDQAEGLAETLNTLLRVYLETMKKEDLYASDERLADLRNRKKTLIEEIKTKSARRTMLAAQLGVTGFDSNAQNPYERLLQESSTAFDEAHRKFVIARAALSAYDPAVGAESQAALEAAAAQIVANDSGLNSLKYHLWARRGELLNEVSGLTSKHPLRAVAERKLRDLDQDVQTATTNLLKATRTQLLEQRRTALRETQQIEQALRAQQLSIQERANWFITNFNEGMTVAQDVDRLQSQLNAISERIDFLTLESEAPGFLRLQSPALPPDRPVGGGPKKPILMVLALAIGLGLIIPIGLDLLDRHIKTVAQVQQLLGFAPVATLLDKQDPRNELVRTDQMRRLILSLSREKRENDTRRIAFTSVKAGGGVTDLIIELAREFTRDGLRVIAVEANAFKPDERYGPLVPGLIDLLNEEVSLEQVIRPAKDGLPDRISVGLALQRHLPFYDRFPQALDPLLECYDIILLDTPPVLLSADTEYLARYADAVLLLTQAHHTLPGELRRAVGLLEKADPRVFGVIVTHLQVYKGGGYYDEMVRKYQESEVTTRQLIQKRLDKAGFPASSEVATGKAASDKAVSTSRDG